MNMNWLHVLENIGIQSIPIVQSVNPLAGMVAQLVANAVVQAQSTPQSGPDKKAQVMDKVNAGLDAAGASVPDQHLSALVDAFVAAVKNLQVAEAK